MKFCSWGVQSSHFHSVFLFPPSQLDRFLVHALRCFLLYCRVLWPQATVTQQLGDETIRLLPVWKICPANICFLLFNVPACVSVALFKWVRSMKHSGLKRPPRTLCRIMSLAVCEIPHRKRWEINAAGGLSYQTLLHPSPSLWHTLMRTHTFTCRHTNAY